MKILFLAPQPFYTERGTPIAVRLAVSSLCRAGHRVDLLTYPEGEDIAIPGMRLFRAGRPPGVRKIPIGFSVRKLLCDLWLMFAAFRMLRGGHYDVVHAVEESVFIALLARLFWRFKLVYDMDSLMADQIAEKWPKIEPLLPFMRWFEHQAMQRSDLVLAVCPLIAERARRCQDAERVHLTPDVAFSPDTAETLEVENLRSYCPQPGPMALYVGNLEPYQGIGLLLQAMAAMEPAQRCNLLVIGGTDASVQDYVVKTKAAGLEDWVRFLGQRPLGALPAYLEQADILCSPRLKGVNTPMKIYSYMLAGRAILATDIASHRQVLDTTCAMLTAPRPDAMAEGWLRLLASQQLRSELGMTAAHRAGTLYCEQAFDQRLKNAYEVLHPAVALSRLAA
ncbi:glycosyl transferase family 1 [Methylobacillus sp. MM3]|uniref:glycosyltransferase n=1 Tax=Methylobacillus sp. MM3 TaxID=1848039 RepID=UPI0007E11958|nr:glycosyltransferase [Methylobacillus sp. MM3]OAJ69425.1 glycosyl transferase family 1 [Methylobacillus sp. MM3]